MHTRLLPLSAIVALLLSPTLCTRAHAQEAFDKGFLPFQAYDSTSFDSVNPNTGNLVLHIPLFSYPQRGGLPNFEAYAFTNNWSWFAERKCQNCNPVYTPSIPHGVPAIQYTPSFYIKEYSWKDPFNDQISHAYHAVDESGAHHILGSIGASLSFTYRSTDGIGIFYNGVNHTLLDRSGINFLNVAVLTSSTGTGPSSIQDANGNIITASASGWTDSIGRFIPAVTYPSAAGCTTTNFPGPNGGTVPLTLCYGTYTVTSAFCPTYCGGVDYDGSYPGNLFLQSITLPNGRQWVFTYNSWGDISTITTPTGATITYTWKIVEACGITSVVYNRGVATRTVDLHDGNAPQVWTYNAGVVTDPLGNDTVHSGGSCGGPEGTVQYYNGSHAGSGLIKTVQTGYSAGGGSNAENPYYYIDKATTTVGSLPVSKTTTWANGQVSQETYSYDNAGGLTFYDRNTDQPTPGNFFLSYGDILQKTESDYGTNAPGALLTTTNYSYLWQSNSNYITPNILDRPCLVTVYGPGAVPSQTSCTPPAAQPNQAAQTIYAYDENNGSPQGFLGNQTSVTRWSNVGTSPKAQAVYNSQGMPTQQVDANLNITTSTYDTTGLFPSQIQYPTTNGVSHIERFTYDANIAKMKTHTDQNSQQTTFTYDSTRRLTSVAYPTGGGSETFQYNDSLPASFTYTRQINGSTNLVKVGKVDQLGRLIQTTLTSDPDCSTGDRTDTTYDSLGRVHTVSNPYCTTSDSTYGMTTYFDDALGRITSATLQDGSGITTSYSGNTTTVTDPVGKIRKSVADGLGRLIEVDEPGTGAQLAISGSGQLTVSGTEQSKTLSATHSTGSITINSVSTPYSQSVTVGSYTCHLSLPTSAPGSSAAGAVASCLNGHLVNAGSSGNVVSLTSIATGSSTNYGISMSGFSGSHSGMSGGTDSSTTYDTGTLSVTVNAFPVSVSYGSTSNAAGLASALASAFSLAGSPYTASSNGATITLTSKAAGSATNYSVSTSLTWNTSNFTSASFGFQTPVISSLTGGTDGSLGSAPLVTLYIYDALGNLLSVTQKGGSTDSMQWRPRTFAYDSLSRLTSSTNPESNTVPSTGATLATTYAYDANGSLSSKTAPAPNQTSTATVTLSYCYDALNRITSKAYTAQSCPMPAPVASYFYDQSSYNGLTITNGIGRRTGMSDAAGAEAWSYDAMGRTITDSRTTSGVTKNTTYAYSPYLDGSINTITYPSGRVITYSTGTAERPLSAQDNSTSVYYAASAHYTPSGALSSLANGVSLTSTLFYNPRLQPCRISVKSSGTAPTTCTGTGVGNVLDFTYSFNFGSVNNGNVASIANNRDNTRSQNFTYDALNRLYTAQTQTTGVTIPNSNCWGLTFGYDPWGNLLQSSTTGPVGCGEPLPLNVSVGTSNRILTNTVTGQVTNHCYDTAGNLIHTVLAPATCPTSGPYQYTYNAENQLTSTAGLSYTYDGDGKRVQKSNGKLYWYGMGGDPLDETDAQGNTNNSSFNEYVFFDGKRIARRDYQNNVFYHFADHLGTTRVSTNSSGTICYDADFYPFGGERIVTDSCDSAYKFTGKERDSESGLDNFGARFDSSSLGRFMLPDPLMESAKVWDPQTWNRYTYALNNPLLFIDPTGMEEVTADQCAKDKHCVTVNVNVIYDKNANNGKGLTDAQKSAFEKGQLQNAKDEYGTADIHLNVTYTAGALTIDKGNASVSGEKEGALNVVVTDQVLKGKSGMAGNMAVSLIPVNSMEKDPLSHEMAHQFMGDPHSLMNRITSLDPTDISHQIYNGLADVANDSERAWMNTFDRHVSWYPAASAFNHNAGVFQKRIQPTTKPQ